MIERQAREFERLRSVGREPIVPCDRAADRGHRQRGAPGFAQVRDHDDALDRGQRGDDLGDLVLDRNRLAVVPVAIDGEEHARLDLPEAVEHAAHAEIGRARRPHRAEAGAAQHRDDGLGHVGNVGGDTVARGDAVGLQRRRDAGGGGATSSALRNAARALVFAAEHERVGRTGRAIAREQVLGEIEAGVRKPSRAGHFVAVDERALAALADDAAEIPDRPPEWLALVVRPPPQRLVVGDGRARGFRRAPRERRDVRRAMRSRRLPEKI